jgi:hypothetical protein
LLPEKLSKKHKKLFKTDEGILKRFDLKLRYWDEDNAIY